MRMPDLIFWIQPASYKNPEKGGGGVVVNFLDSQAASFRRFTAGRAGSLRPETALRLCCVRGQGVLSPGTQGRRSTADEPSQDHTCLPWLLGTWREAVVSPRGGNTDINSAPVSLAYNVIALGRVLLCRSDLRLRAGEQRIRCLWAEYPRPLERLSSASTSGCN